jgi:hypothetical protein
LTQECVRQPLIAIFSRLFGNTNKKPPIASNPDSDSNHGISQTQDWLLPGICGTNRSNNHDDYGGYSRSDNVVLSPQKHHCQCADPNQRS